MSDGGSLYPNKCRSCIAPINCLCYINKKQINGANMIIVYYDKKEKATIILHNVLKISFGDWRAFIAQGNEPILKIPRSWIREIVIDKTYLTH